MSPSRAGDPSGGSTASLSWICTLIATAASFGYILALSLAPHALSRPIADGSRVSIGLVMGLALATLIVVLAIVYTWVVNRREPA